MRQRLRIDSLSRSAIVLVAGRSVGFVASFAIPVVLARVFEPAEFGTYKQLFLVFATLYGIAQLGMAESLYYFVPRKAEEAGRYVCNALVTLALAGAACIALLAVMRHGVAAWLTNGQLADHLFLLGLLLALMLVATAFEIVMIARKQHMRAALTYATSDIARTLLFTIPALGFGSVRGVLVGAALFAALRVVAMLVYLWREFGSDLHLDVSLWRYQLAYALPFALAVGIEVLQINFHQYVVAASFDAVTFAIYAVGCLQIPLVDLVMTSTVNVMMVKMAEDAKDGRADAALALWHDTICRLAFIIFPLAVFLLLSAHNVIVTLFTTRYVASVPIFMVWTLTILPAAFAVDGVLRVYAQTRFLLAMNVLRLAMVAGLISWFLSTFGLSGAVLVTLIATSLVKVLGVIRMSSVLRVPLGRILPWERLGLIVLGCGIAALPAVWMNHAFALPPFAALACAGLAYGATYAALGYGALWLHGASLSLPFVVRRRLATWLTQ
jgi:O-antigen/teichoic acid export membrane protein